MKKKIPYIILTSVFIFIFIVFFKGMYKTNIYKPLEIKNKKLVEFSSKDLYFNKEININELVSKKNFTIINIWASWCIPCKLEHQNLVKLSKIENLTIVGLNYKDKTKNGTISIQLGAYGVPETFLINRESKILKKYIGQLTFEQILEIKKIIN